MSLKGSLETVALPEVLGFLSGTTKTGELKVDGATGSGWLWFEDGAIAGIQVERGPNPVEAVFQLLRIEEGEFAFDAGQAPPEGVRRVGTGEGQVGAVLEQAQERMGEWADIVAVVPSLDHRVTLLADAPGDSVVLDSSQWSLVVAIGEGRPVGQIIAARDLGEFDGCRAIKTLVEASLVALEEPPVVEIPAAALPMSSPIANALSGIHGFGFGPAAEAPSDTFPAADAFAPSDQPAAAGEPAPVDHYGSLRSMVEEVVDTDDGAEPDSYGVDEAAPMPAFGADGPFEAPADGPFEASPDGTEVASSYAPDSGEVPTEGRAALQALLDEVTGGEYGDEDYDEDYPAEADAGDEAVDGLADRGPWTHNELASFDGWRREETTQAELQAAGVTSYAPGLDQAVAEDGYDGAAVSDRSDPAAFAEDATGELEEEEPAPAEEPINRGLLLKFLSSVRN